MALADLVGMERPGGTLLTSRDRLRLFAKATGQKDPVFVDLDAARAAGHPDLPVPPTFYFSVDMELPDPFGYLAEAGVDLRSLLHGEQEFVYHRFAHAGDELRSSSKVVDYYDKKGGALQFLVTETQVVNQHDELVATLRSTIVVRQITGVGVSQT
jgi:acyl dehydratase